MAADIPLIKHMRYAVEGCMLFCVVGMLRLMPMDTASAFGGWLGRRLGPRTRLHRTAERNLRRVLPELDDEARARVLRGMWDNIGRTSAELPHMTVEAIRPRLAVEGEDIFHRMRDAGQGVVYISGHFGNWEIVPLLSTAYELGLTMLYRKANNPYTERIIIGFRRRYVSRLFGKGREGVRAIVAAMRERSGIGLLADQRMNDGEEVEFMGHPAMTVTTPVQMAIRFQAPLVMLRVVRLKGAHFKVEVKEPLYLAPDTDPKEAMRQVHETFDAWVREHPEQWFWVHNRWGWKR